NSERAKVGLRLDLRARAELIRFQVPKDNHPRLLSRDGAAAVGHEDHFIDDALGLPTLDFPLVFQVTIHETPVVGDQSMLAVLVNSQARGKLHAFLLEME